MQWTSTFLPFPRGFQYSCEVNIVGGHWNRCCKSECSPFSHFKFTLSLCGWVIGILYKKIYISMSAAENVKVKNFETQYVYILCVWLERMLKTFSSVRGNVFKWLGRYSRHKSCSKFPPLPILSGCGSFEIQIQNICHCIIRKWFIYFTLYIANTKHKRT